MSMRRTRAAAIAAVALYGALVAGGCSTVGYYAQSVHGHFSVLHAAQPIADLLADPTLDARLRTRLEHVLDIRAYASRELALPSNHSYTEYADLKRPFVVWNVFATKEFSLRLVESCFPVAGCVGYRGFFAQADAEHYAAGLRAQGYDVNVGGVPAYSTLGWFDDPVLNTFIMQPEGETARLIFHELAHQVVYVPGDTRFNESFSTTVELEGVRRWLAARGDPAMQKAYDEYNARRQDFLALLKTARERLEQIYAGNESDADRRAAKREVFAQLGRDAQTIKRERWGGYAGYDRFFARELGNAHLASIATYTQWVPAFDALLAEEHGDLARFYARVKALAALDRAARHQALAQRCPACEPMTADDVQ